jgi:hypothetical protein
LLLKQSSDFNGASQVANLESVDYNVKTGQSLKEDEELIFASFDHVTE